MQKLLLLLKMQQVLIVVKSSHVKFFLFIFLEFQLDFGFVLGNTVMRSSLLPRQGKLGLKKASTKEVLSSQDHFFFFFEFSPTLKNVVRSCCVRPKNTFTRTAPNDSLTIPRCCCCCCCCHSSLLSLQFEFFFYFKHFCINEKKGLCVMRLCTQLHTSNVFLLSRNQEKC